MLWRPFWKWRPVEILQCRDTIRDIIIYPHIKLWWYRKMLNFCGIVVAILKMATGRNFSMSGINSGHHYLPTYQILMISDNVEFLHIVGAILKMVTSRNCSMSGINSWHHYLPTINCDDIGQCWIFAMLWRPFWKWRPVEIFISGINSGYYYLPTYQILMISDNIEFLRYCGGHFENGDQ